jgi:hypothetical protein
MNDTADRGCTAFDGGRMVMSGPLFEVAEVVKHLLDRGELNSVLVFDDASGRAIDLELSGTAADVRARYMPGERGGASEPGDRDTPGRGRGRPRLGVVSHEVTLLPRHWGWLKAQRGGASATLRRLVDQARRETAATERVQRGQDATYRFLAATVGDEPGFEEAIRALYSGNAARFCAEAEQWPADLRDHAIRLAEAAFVAP